MDMQFSGLLRVKFSPLVPVSPFIQALQLSFLEKPHIDFRFKIAGLDAMSVSVPGVLDVAETVIEAIKSSLEMMVYPTHLVVPLIEDDALASSELTRSPPHGVLRFTIVAASVSFESYPLLTAVLELLKRTPPRFVFVLLRGTCRAWTRTW